MRFINLVILLLMSLSIFSQNVTVSGHILDETGEAIPNAIIFDSLTSKNTTSNQYGFFSLSLTKGRSLLQTVFVGSEKAIISLLLTRDTSIEIRLRQTTLQEVVVRDAKTNTHEKISTTILPMAQMKKIPAIGGEVDIIKALSLTPGVEGGAEGSAGLYVRGGTPDENLILLDEAIVYNPNHIFGLVSVFNPDAIKSVELIKGGFPARYGGRLSSVLDVVMREGNYERNKTSYGIGLLSSRLYLERVLDKEKLGLMVSARSSYLGFLLLPRWVAYKSASSGSISSYLNYFMYDINAKLNYTLLNKDQLIWSFYLGKDDLRSFDRSSNFEEKTFLNWGNLTSTLRYNKILTPKLFWKSMLIYSKFLYQNDFYQNNAAKGFYEEFNNRSGLTDYTLKSELDYIPNNNHYIRAGIEGTYHNFLPESKYYQTNDTTQRNTAQTERLGAFEPALFIEDEWKIFNRFKLNGGVRLDLYHAPGKNYFSLEPRLTAVYDLGNGWNFKAAYTKMQQNIHLLTNSGVGYQNDVWVPSTASVRPQQSRQWGAGFSKYFVGPDLELQAEAYSKTMTDLIDYQEGSNIVTNLTGWEKIVEKNGLGWSKGIELFLHKKTGRLNGFVSYTYAKSDRQFADINGGDKFPFRYDNRHNFAVTGNFQISRRWDISGTWVYKSGEPTTIPLYTIDRFDYGVPGTVYTTRNGYRLPEYHRADVAINYTKQTKKGNTKTWSFSAFNVYNRQNVSYIRIETTATTDDKGVITYHQHLKPVTAFGIIPGISFSKTFK